MTENRCIVATWLAKLAFEHLLCTGIHILWSCPSKAPCKSDLILTAPPWIPQPPQPSHLHPHPAQPLPTQPHAPQHLFAADTNKPS